MSMKAIWVVIAALLVPIVLVHAEGTVPADQAWGIFRDGSKIGERTTRFERDGDDLIVETESRIKIKIAFITVYGRSEQMREVRRHGNLAEFVSEIDDDGDKHRVEAVRGEDGLIINGHAHSYVAPDGIVPATYWNIETVSANALLEGKKGEVLDVETVPAGRGALNVNGTTVHADRYRMNGDEEMDLWYDDEDRLVRAQFVTRDGSTIEFRQRASDQ